MVNCAGVASDGMRISRYDTFDAATPEGLPADSIVIKSINRLIKELDALLKAPLAQPYSGPAILVNRAPGSISTRFSDTG